jgi:hypothetical protein
LEGRIEGLQKWRLEVEIWRGLKNKGSFEGPAGVVFCTKPSKFEVKAHMKAPTGVLSKTFFCFCN